MNKHCEMCFEEEPIHVIRFTFGSDFLEADLCNRCYMVVLNNQIPTIERVDGV